MSQRWTTVFMGPPAEAELVRARLEMRGILAFIPEETGRTICPLDFGGLLTFDRAVQVPESTVEQARALLAEKDEGTEIQPGERELPPEFFGDDAAAPDDEQETARKEAAAYSRRILFGAVLPIGAPFVLLQIGPYLRAVEKLERRPPWFKTTVAAACLSPFYFAACFLPAVWWGF